MWPLKYILNILNTDLPFETLNCLKSTFYLICKVQILCNFYTNQHIFFISDIIGSFCKSNKLAQSKLANEFHSFEHSGILEGLLLKKIHA